MCPLGPGPSITLSEEEHHESLDKFPGARVSLSELTENRGLFITKVFISIQFTNRLVRSGACICSQEGDWPDPLADGCSPGHDPSDRGRGLEEGRVSESNTPSPREEGSTLPASLRVMLWKLGYHSE